MQPESSLTQEPQVEAVQNAPKKFNFLAVLVVILVLALVGLCYWAFTLNSSLAANRQELATLQSQYDSLMTEKSGLSSNLDKTTTDLAATQVELEKTKTDLSNTQADLEKTKGDLASAQNEMATLRANMDKASKWMDVAIAIFVDDENRVSITEKVNALEDNKLTGMWDDVDKAFKDASKSASSFADFAGKLQAFNRHLLSSIKDFLN